MLTPVVGSVTGARPFYDLTNPVIYQRDEATVSPIDDETKVAPARRKQPSGNSAISSTLSLAQPLDLTHSTAIDVGRPEFEAFASNLLSSIAFSPELSRNPFPQLSSSIGGRSVPRSIMEVRPEMRPEMSSHRGGGPEAFGIDLDEANGCKAAVEIVSRNSQKGKIQLYFLDNRSLSRFSLFDDFYSFVRYQQGWLPRRSIDSRQVRLSSR